MTSRATAIGIACILVGNLCADEASDLKTLSTVNVKTDTPSLLAFLQKHTPKLEDIKQIEKLIRELGHDDFETREQASTRLIRLGGMARSALQRATKHRDLERSRRARKCLKKIGSDQSSQPLQAAVRLLARRKVVKSVQAMLDLVGFSSNEELESTIIQSLSTFVSQKESIPTLLNALKSTLPLTRATAAVVLAKSYRNESLKVLLDVDPQVRLRVALVLARLGERAAIPALIDLIGALSSNDLWRVENLLMSLAGEKSPTAPTGNDIEGIEKYRKAWKFWWTKTGAKLNLVKLLDQPPFLGYTLIVLLSKGKVVELDRNNKKRWEITGLNSPLDAEIVTGGRVLIAEYGSKRVTERSLDGKIRWQKTLRKGPIRAQRLPNGQTFIVTRDRILLVNRDGSETTLVNPGPSITTARRFPNGNIAAHHSGKCNIYSGNGKLIQSFQANRISITSAIDAIPNGNVLLLEYGGGRVTERTRTGKVLWEVTEKRPISGVRLPNGRTLISSQDGYVAVYDRKGNRINKIDAGGHPTQVRGR